MVMARKKIIADNSNITKTPSQTLEQISTINPLKEIDRTDHYFIAPRSK